VNDADDFQLLLEEYKRLCAEEDKNHAHASPYAVFFSIPAARGRMREFCLTTGKDMTLLNAVFQQEDVWMSSFVVPS
jgi:hypothetical protein